jgi:hypothetical protein
MTLNHAVLTVLLAVAFFLGPQTGAAENVQAPRCFPNRPEAVQWPIHAIYLHGLFTAKGKDIWGFRATEAENRGKLEALANRLHIRIAAPVAQSFSKDGFRQWNGATLEQVEAAAREACSDAPLAPKRALIGFANGGQWVGDVGKAMGCEALKAYSTILDIGDPGAPAQRCGEFIYIKKHEFPSSLDNALMDLKQTGAKTAKTQVEDDQ